MSELEVALRRQIVAEVYRQAGELDWDGMTDRERSAAYDRWLDDSAIGRELARYVPRERARVWLKDVPMKEYTRARFGIGVYAELVTVRFPGPGQIIAQVLGSHWDVSPGTIREKPTRCIVYNGARRRLMIWGQPKGLRDLVWAGIIAVADNSPDPLLVVTALENDVLSDAEKKRHVDLGRVAGLEVCHTVLRLVRVVG